MGKKPEMEPVVPDCGSCNGNGGSWDYGNGDGKPKQWISCRVCGGSGKAR